MTDKGTPGFCIFCGSRPTTREHLLPSWLRIPLVQRVGGHKPSIHGTRRVDGTLRLRHQKRPFDSYEWVACHDCNSGWMQRLDSERKDLLKRLVLSEHAATPLDEGAQELLARWITKLDMVWDWVKENHPNLEGPAVSIGPAQRAAFFERQEIPADQRIWIGANSSTQIWRTVRMVHAPFFRIRSVEEVADRAHPDAHWATYAVGGLCFQVLGTNGVDVSPIDLPSGLPMAQIWPYIAPVDFPGPGTMDDAVLSRLAHWIDPTKVDPFSPAE